MANAKDNKPKVITTADLYERLETRVEPRIKRLEIMVAVAMATGIWNVIGRPSPEEMAAAIAQFLSF